MQYLVRVALVGLCAALGTSLMLPLPASGAGRTFKDPRGDGAGSADVRRVEVSYTTRALVVRVKVPDVTRDGSISVYVDSNVNRPGPEFVLLGPISLEGYDWRVAKVAQRWRSTNAEVLCGSRLRSLRASNVVKISFGQDCLTNPDTLNRVTGEITENTPRMAPPTVRVSVVTQGSDRSRDWAPGPRRFLPPVGRG